MSDGETGARPTIDNTYGTATGYYMYTDSTEAVNDQSAQVTTGLI